MTLETAERVALVAALVLLGLAAVALLVVRAVVAKLLTVALLAAVAAGAWSQREAVRECADRVRADPSLDTTCTFLGRDVTVTR